MPASVKILKDKNDNIIYPKIAKEGFVEPLDGNDVGIDPITGLQSSTVQGALNELAGKSGGKVYTVTFLATGWTGDAAPYTQTIEVEGILETDVPVVGPKVTASTTDDINAQFEAFGKVRRYTTQDGSITGYCYEETPPEIDYTAMFKL